MNGVPALAAQYGGLAERFALRDLRAVCPGMVRATQQLRVGGEDICTDEVLIEEVVYRLPDELALEVSSLTLKMGMLSPFTRNSTYPPKYYHIDEARSTAWFITSVPPVSLAVVLEQMRARFPPHYTWDRTAYVHDLLAAVSGAFSAAWAARRRPGRAVAVFGEALEHTLPQRIPPQERLQFAAMLVDAVRPRHAAGIYHNNITPHTIFFTDPLSPRFLCNYGGTVPPVMGAYIPEAIRHRHRDDTFGEQSMDTFALALLTYEIVTGKPLSGPHFTLDEGRAISAPELLQRRFPRSLRPLNGLLDLLQEVWLAGVRLADGVAALFDQARCPRLRMLTRASGSLLRCLPLARGIADLWLPTEIAQALRTILDRSANDRMCGPRSRLNRSSRRKRNVNTTYLRAALPAQTLRRDSRLAHFIQEIIDQAVQRTDLVDEDAPAVPPLRLRLGRPELVRYAAGVAMLALVCIGTANHQRMPRLERPPVDVLAMAQPRVAAASPAAAVEPQPAAGETTEAAPARPQEPPARPTRKAIRNKIAPEPQPAVAPEPPSPPLSPTCHAFLAPNKKYRDVYRVTDLTDDCGLGDLAIRALPERGAPFATLGDAYVRFYVTKRHARGYGDIMTVQQCRSDDAERCERGRLYQVEGIGELGDEVELEEGDVVGFSKFHLLTFRNSVR